MARAHLTELHVCEISFQCRDLGYGIEEGVIEAFWTGEIDVWGKYTIRPTNGAPALYLFPDEIIRVWA